MKVYGDPWPKRRPSISTKVRFGPSPRRSAVAMPPAVVKPLVVLPRSCPSELLKICGSCRMRSLISVFPLVSMYCEDSTWIGLVLTAFGAAIRDPVTMISVRAGSVSAAATAACCARAGRGAKAIAAATNKYCDVLLSAAMAAATRPRAALVLANPNVIIIRPPKVFTGPAEISSATCVATLQPSLRFGSAPQSLASKKYASFAAELKTCDEVHQRGDEAPSYEINSCRSGDRSLNGALRRLETGPCPNPGGDPRHTCERALPRKDLLLYAAHRMIEGPCHRAGTNDPRSGASS